MADDVTLPGDGAVIATDDVGGRQFQIVKQAYGADGEATQVSTAAPLPMAAYGELIEALEAMRMAIASLTRTIGQAMPDTAGRMRVNVETGAVTASLAANQTLAIVTTLTNQTQIGGLAATEHIPSLMRLGADSARRNITTS
jgi:hypothetical protein